MNVELIENSFDESLKDIILSTDNTRLLISFSGNGDLYLKAFCRENKSNYLKFSIQKDNDVYPYFDMLYSNLCSSLASSSEYDKINNYIMVKNFLEDISFEEYLKQSKIVFFSDSAPLGECNSLAISQNDEQGIVLEFINNELDSLRGFNVRISNSGSRHKPLNVSFMKMYNSLQDYKKPDNEEIKE